MTYLACFVQTIDCFIVCVHHQFHEQSIQWNRNQNERESVIYIMDNTKLNRLCQIQIHIDIFSQNAFCAHTHNKWSITK